MIRIHGRGFFCLLLLLAAAPALPQVMIGRTPAPPDLAGEWVLVGNEDRGAVGGLQPNPDDYLGVPFNEAGRMRSDTTAESVWGMAQFQCRPHSAPHQWRGLGGARILNELDPLDRSLKTLHIQFWRSLDRPIFMDGRPHPPAWAPHSWTGFSTGRWEGNTLVVKTTHLKEGFLKRGGPQTSDMLTMTEYLTRHDDILTIVQVTDDPVYMDEPFVQSTAYVYDPTSRVNFETCNAGNFAETGGTDPHFVPHHLPGRELFINEWLPNESWIPYQAVRGGVKTLYPEYRATLEDGGASLDDLDVPASANELPAAERIGAQSPGDGEIHILPVQGNVYMLIADGRNLAVSVGDDGLLMVNSGPARMTEQIQAALEQLQSRRALAAPNNCTGMNCPGFPGWSSPWFNAVVSSTAPQRPLRYILNTSAAPHNTGGNAVLAAAGFGRGEQAAVIGHENALIAMSGPSDDAWSTDAGAWPTEAWYGRLFKMPAYFNGEAILGYHAPDASTDGDMIVFFRDSEVISAGDLYSTVSYPRIHLERGGRVQGVIAGLNQILDLAFAEYRSQGGTWIIPGRGRLADTADLASYRNMVQIVSDRVQALIDKGMSLEEVQAARPTLDFDPRYGADEGEWTTAMFVAAVYQSLAQ